MASAEAPTTTIRIPVGLKRQLDEYRRPGQSYNGFIKEILLTAYEAGVIAKAVIVPPKRRVRRR